MTNLNFERLKLRAAGRGQARSLRKSMSITDPEAIAAFLDEMNDLLKPLLPTVESCLDIPTIRQLSAIELPRGIHVGKRLDEAPRDYLHWWVTESDAITNDIARYLDLTKDQDDE